jgi:hypothetical protein
MSNSVIRLNYPKPPTEYLGPKTFCSLLPGCRYQICRTVTPGICSKCRYVHYCCEEHRANDRDNHDQLCNHISVLLAALKPCEKEGIQDLFRSTQHNLLLTLLEADTFGTICWALDLACSMLRADRKDACYIRQIVPFILLRLGLDPLCLDFCTAWNDESQMIDNATISYSVKSSTQLTFGIQPVDVYQLDGFAFGPPDPRHSHMMVALMLFKLRLHMRLGQEDIRHHEQIRLLAQIKELYLKLNSVNTEFWPLLLYNLTGQQSPQELLNEVMKGTAVTKPQRPSQELLKRVMEGTADTKGRLLIISYDAWKETPDAYLRLQHHVRKHKTKTWEESLRASKNRS